MTSTVGRIHPTAVVHPSARIDPTAEIGPYVVIGEDVTIAEGVQVGPHAVIEFAEVGANCRIHAGAFVGTAPQDLKYRGERTKLIVGPGCMVRECVTLNRGTAASGATRIGSRCLFMAYSHVAHDCIIGDEVIVANSVAIAGHCEIGSWSVIGGMAGIHQFVRVGKLAMIGAGSMVPLDIPPYTMAQGDRAKLSGLNVVGLKRRALPPADVADLKKIYFEVFDNDRPFKDTLAELQKQPRTPAVQEFLAFLAASPRGVTRPPARGRAESSEQEGVNTSRLVGLIAGNGTFPLHVARAARTRGDRVVAVALKEEADPELSAAVEEMTWLSVGQIGKTIDFFKSRGVSQAVMAGQVKHTQLFKNIIPDFRAAKILARVANKKAESLLSAVIDEFQTEGIEFLSSVAYLDAWLCPEGTLTRKSPTVEQKKDIAFGLPVAHRLADLDIGQTLVVKDQSIVAVEAMEGTDACIRRAGQIAGPGCVVIKVARPKQDLRFDVPVVGLRTLEALKDAKAGVLAMEAGKTLLLDKPQWVEQANTYALTIQGVLA